MFERRWMGCVWVWTGLVLSVGWPAGAQIGAGVLTGDVVDQAGAAVPGATVTVTADGTNLSRTVVTGAGRRYVVPGWRPVPIGCA